MNAPQYDTGEQSMYDRMCAALEIEPPDMPSWADAEQMYFDAFGSEMLEQLRHGVYGDQS